MSDYDAGDITDRERLAAERQRELANANADAVRQEFNNTMSNYDTARLQNARLRDVQLKQAGRKNETDRFEAARQLQNASIGLLGSMGNTALNGSALGNLAYMLQNRNDADNNTYWQQLMDNYNAVTNAYEESENQNTIARLDAATKGQKALSDIESDTAAMMSNINPNLYERPDLGASNFYEQNKANPNLAVLSGYIMPENAEQNIRQNRNKIQKNDYFSQQLNRINGR